MINSPEGKLYPPPDYVLPGFQKSIREDLINLSQKSSLLSLNPAKELESDSLTFSGVEKQSWGLSKKSLPNVLAMCRVDYDHEFFVAMPKHPYQVPGTFNLLIKPAGSRADRGLVVTITGEEVEADLCGLIFTSYLESDVDSNDLSIIKHNLNPRNEKGTASPEIFTFKSAFNNAIDDWPQATRLDDIENLSSVSQEAMANSFLDCGLEALANESENRHARLSAQRLINMCEGDQVNLHLTFDPRAFLRQEIGMEEEKVQMFLPEEHGLAYVPLNESCYRGIVLVPFQWVVESTKKPINSLAHLVRVSSFVRDDYFKRLRGSEFIYCKELQRGGEVSNFTFALMQADGLVSMFLDEVEKSDRKIYGINPKLDKYCLDVRNKQHFFRPYDDPPESGRRGILI